jgi:hypothetical protein
MAPIYVFADENGDLSYNSENQFFGFGTATFFSAKEINFADAFKLRCDLEAKGVPNIAGFHASSDSNRTRSEVFTLIQQQKPRFDFTFLEKRHAIPSVVMGGEIYLYKLAWFLHFKHLMKQIATASESIFAITASMTTKAKTKSIQSALSEVAWQLGARQVVPVWWNSNTSWGLQMADYGLWAAQRSLNPDSDTWFDRYIREFTYSKFEPWKK